MSFILDALRKSETQRQQQTGPGLADAQYRSAKSKKNFWLPLLVVVLALNAVVLIVVLTNRPADPIEPAPFADRAATSQGIDSRDIRPLAREIPKPDEPAVARPTAVDTGPAGPSPTIAASSEIPVTSTPASTEPGTVQEGLPSMQQLVVSGALAIPSLHLDIHVYASTPPERFVFVNMKKYREGDTLVEGPAVDEITKTGVVLSYQGNRFTLDRD